MEKKELTIDDFPLESTDAVKEAFASNAKIQRTVKLLTDSLVESLSSLDSIDPWAIVRKEMPEISQFQIGGRFVSLRYDQVSQNFVVKPE